MVDGTLSSALSKKNTHTHTLTQPVGEYHNDVNQYHDQMERPEHRAGPPAGHGAVSAIPTGKGMR